MSLTFVTYRWDESFVGGAELHHQRLARELVDLGCPVNVLTTDGGEIRPFCHWGVEWTRLNAPAASEADLPVERFPVRRLPKAIGAAGVKYIQRQAEREEAAIDQTFLETLVRESGIGDEVFLLSGWHYPEIGEGGKAQRWTQASAYFVLQGDDLAAKRLVLRGYAPKPARVSIRQHGKTLAENEFPAGDVCLVAELDRGQPGIYQISCSRIWRPLRDFRGLGIMVHALETVPRESNEVLESANLVADYRSLGRMAPETWQEHLFERARNRPSIYGTIMDRMRGPYSPGLRRAAASIRGRALWCNLPWATMSRIREGDLAMALWHIEDEFYYWQHWIDALKRSRLVLANTPYTAGNFFPKLGIDAAFVGPPIWPAEVEPTPEEVAAFRNDHGISGEEVLVLTVCRKSGEKRYEAVAGACAALHDEGLPVRMIGVGPDGDGRPFSYTGCSWIGKLRGNELQVAYAACDVFCLMSESESFGMVIPEAWHHGKPVVVNRSCGPAASLVDEGTDGMLAIPGKELADTLRVLCRDSEKRLAMGISGQEKARRLYTRGAAGRRLLKAMEERKLL